MRKQIPLLFCLAVVAAVALSGCLSNQGVTTASYKNDVITVEDYYVSNLQPYAGSETTMSFLLQNNGEQPAGRVKVSFITNMEMVDLKCAGTTSHATDAGSRYCVFDASNEVGAIEPFDVRSVELRLKAPLSGSSGVSKPTEFAVSYSVEYDYSGYRKADLPVIDGVTMRTASSKYSQSTASYGPVTLSFEIPARGTHKENGQTVTDYWGVHGEPFEVLFKLTDSANTGLKDKAPVVPAGSIRLDTKGSLSMVDGMPCDFEERADGYLYSKADEKVPGNLRCSFKSADFAEPEMLATLWAEYSYTYGYTLTEKFQVQPIGET